MEKSYRRHDISDRMCVLGVIKTKVILLVVLVFLSLALFETQIAQAGTSSSKIRDFQGISPPENDGLLEAEQLAYKILLLKQR